jgi:hypothetical protein
MKTHVPAFALGVGYLIVAALAVLMVKGCVGDAHAEPTNAPDTRGHFVLVVGGTANDIDSCGAVCSDDTQKAQRRIQPFTVSGFTSFHMCRGAGVELQARLNHDGYVLDFVCVAVSKL